MSTYRKLPIEIQAFKWTGGPDQEEDPLWIIAAIKRGEVFFDSLRLMNIRTLEGTMIAQPGDWIIQGVKGEIYPCKEDIFLATYEEVKE